ncbi:MAG: membrane protein insertase YidC [Planctomycetota bacterium]|nr:MAG: membrane protein insertase YidC [Planctomycetota bacterium]
MPREPNTALRWIVPALAVGVAAIFVIAVAKSPPSPAAAPAAAPATQQAGESASEEEKAAAADSQPAVVEQTPAATAVQPEPHEETTAETLTGGADQQPAAGPTEGLRVRLVAPPPDGSFGSIGSDDPDSGYDLLVEFTPEGAGVGAITLSEHYKTVRKREHYAVQQRRLVTDPSGATATVASLAARAIEIDGQTVDLFASGREDLWIWRLESLDAGSARFSALIENDQGQPVARIERMYSLAKGSYDVQVRQRVVNLTDHALGVRFAQFGAVDLPADNLGYGGDKRRVRFGALLDAALDPSRQTVRPLEGLGARRLVVGKAPAPRVKTVYPPAGGSRITRELVWAAMTNRYFAFAVHAIPPAGADLTQPWNKALPLGARVDRVLAGPADASGVVLLEHHSAAMTIEPGEAASLDFGAYAGPLWRKTLGADPLLRSVGLHELVVFNFGGPCAFCTFQPLAKALLWFLGTTHDLLFHDWALAIMFLVLCVRGALHPVTKRAQINMQRFSRKMQTLAPKQKKIQEKYKDDPQRLREEMAKLMREEGVNPAQALGCLPMFLQTPVWIALYAMLFFAFDLRHQPAFFGIFQKLSGGSWLFLADLSKPDRFVYFGKPLATLPLLGPIDSINLLPLLLAFVFYAQQKYLTPPPSTAMTPEQAQQQKIMRVLMVVMFPLIMYSAPSGLAIYFITNSILGILESRHIRAHIDLEALEKADQEKRARRRSGLAAQAGGARRKTRTPANPFDKSWRREDNGKGPKRRRGRSR